MDDALEIHEYRGYDIHVLYDSEPESPREWDNLGRMFCFHNRYNLGDKHDYLKGDFDNWPDFRKQLELDGYKNILPLYLYDHSGITISTKPFSSVWDSGQVGFIGVSDKELGMVLGYGDPPADDVTQNILEAEVLTYDHYLTGRVYGYTIHDDGEEVDSGWGWYGDWDDEDGMLHECLSIIDSYHT